MRKSALFVSIFKSVQLPLILRSWRGVGNC